MGFVDRFFGSPELYWWKSVLLYKGLLLSGAIAWQCPLSLLDLLLYINA